MRYTILHHHFFKNSGSTVEEMLDQSFGGRFVRLDGQERDHIISHQELLEFLAVNPQVAAVSSHQVRYPMPEVPGLLLFDVCFLRDPVDRIRSMYEYFRKRPAWGDPVSDLANECGPGEYLARLIEEHPLYVRDVQVNLLAAGGDSDRPTEADLEVAARRIREASFPGVVDLFRESVAAGEYFLRQVFPELRSGAEATNVSSALEGARGGRVDLKRESAPGTYEKLVEMNALDFRLLEVARYEVRKRFDSIPVTFEALGEVRSRAGCGELFDSAFYLEQNPDVAAAGGDPLKHYIRHGSAEGRKPHPWFQPDYYLAQHPEAGLGAGNPLLHYLKTGAGNPHRLFDADAWKAANPGNPGNPLLEQLAAGDRPGTFVVDDVPLPDGEFPEIRRFQNALNYGQARAQLQT